jgi:hypothetical protein
METQTANQKPQSVDTAVNLLWASLVVGIVKSLLDFTHISGTASAKSVVAVMIFTLAFRVFPFIFCF